MRRKPKDAIITLKINATVAREAAVALSEITRAALDHIAKNPAVTEAHFGDDARPLCAIKVDY